jgi:hypothetical protein
MALAGVPRPCARGIGRSDRRRRLACAFVGLRTLNEAHLLLLRLTLEVLVGTKRQRATDEDDSVKANTGRGAIGCRGGGAGLCVALGLWVALLCSCQLILSRNVWCM